MSNKRVLLFLVALVVLVNYNNYFLPDRDRLFRKIEMLQNRIAREKRLSAVKVDPKMLKDPFKSYFFDGKRYNYSQAMGKFQEMIDGSAKGLCTVKNIQWAQEPQSSTWYDRLKLHAQLECHPDHLFSFVDKMHRYRKLVYLESIHLGRKGRTDKLMVTLDLVAFRMHADEKK